MTHVPSTIPFALVVDDDTLILLHACDILEEAGFRPLEAGSGDEACKVLGDDGAGVILLFTDVEMPGEMNGFQLASHVAARFPDIEIVVASGRISPAAGDLPEKATFIQKPFSAALVKDHLREKLPDGKKPEPLKQPR